MKLGINVDDFTLGDMDDFEAETGMSLDEALAPRPVNGPDGKPLRGEKGRPVTTSRPPAKALVGMVWLAMRHDNPAFTYADARNVRLVDLDISGDAPDPKETRD